MSEITSDGFNFAEVDVTNMEVKIGGRKKRMSGKVVVADNKEAYGGDAKTIAAMAAETVARVTGDARQADRAYEQAREQAEGDPQARLNVIKTRNWMHKNKIADASLKFDPARDVWYLRYLKVDKTTGFISPHYREITEDQMNRLGQRLQDMGAE